MTDAARTSQSDRRYRSLAELARACNVNERTVRRWIDRGLRPDAHGWFVAADVAAFVRGLRARGDATRSRKQQANKLELAAPAPASDADAPQPGGLLADERARVDLRHRQLRAAKIAEELKRMRGETVERGAVADLLRMRMTAFKRELRATGRRLSVQLAGLTDPLEIQQIIDDALDAILWRCYGRPPAGEGAHGA